MHRHSKESENDCIRNDALPDFAFSADFQVGGTGGRRRALEFGGEIGFARVHILRCGKLGDDALVDRRMIADPNIQAVAVARLRVCALLPSRRLLARLLL